MTSNGPSVTSNAVTNAVSNGTPSYPTRPDPSRPGLQRKEGWLRLHASSLSEGSGSASMHGSLRSLEVSA
jgi:hypothetical protein